MTKDKIILLVVFLCLLLVGRRCMDMILKLQSLSASDVVLMQTRMITESHLQNPNSVIFGSSTVRKLQRFFKIEEAIGVNWLKTNQLREIVQEAGTFPCVVFLYVGTNDLLFDEDDDIIIENILVISQKFKQVIFIPIILSPLQIIRKQNARINYINKSVASRIPSLDLPSFQWTDFSYDLLHLNHRGLHRLKQAIKSHPAWTSV
jgi:hypothetical protein